MVWEKDLGQVLTLEILNPSPLFVPDVFLYNELRYVLLDSNFVNI